MLAIGPLAMFGILWGLDWSGVISTSWWWITAPLWGGIALVTAFALVVLVLGALGVAGAKMQSRIWEGRYKGRHRREANRKNPLSKLSERAEKLLDDL